MSDAFKCRTFDFFLLNSIIDSFLNAKHDFFLYDIHNNNIEFSAKIKVKRLNFLPTKGFLKTCANNKVVYMSKQSLYSTMIKIFPKVKSL